MTKIWQQRELGDGWWAAAGRIKGWALDAPWLWRRKPGFLELSFFGLFGIGICWSTGLYISVGASFIGFAGVGYIRRYK